MIVIVNLERLSGDGYKMNANSPLVTPPSYIKYAQLRYTPFTSAQAIQGTFVTGAYSTVEFDVTGANLTRYLKLYTSTDGTTYNEVKSWGGTDGIRQKEYLTYSGVIQNSAEGESTLTQLYNDTGKTCVCTNDTNKTVLTFSSALMATNTTCYICSPLADEQAGFNAVNAILNYEVPSSTVLKFGYVSPITGLFIDSDYIAFTFEIKIYP